MRCQSDSLFDIEDDVLRVFDRRNARVIYLGDDSPTHVDGHSCVREIPAIHSVVSHLHDVGASLAVVISVDGDVVTGSREVGRECRAVLNH